MKTYKSEIVKKKIKQKFGSVNRFCNITGKNFTDIANLFRREEGPQKQEDLKSLSMLVINTKDQPVQGKEVTPELIEQIRVAIVTKYKTYLQFCEEESFSNTWLSTLMNGKMKTISARVRALCKILNINLDGGTK